MVWLRLLLVFILVLRTALLRSPRFTSAIQSRTLWTTYSDIPSTYIPKTLSSRILSGFTPRLSYNRSKIFSLYIWRNEVSIVKFPPFIPTSLKISWTERGIIPWVDGSSKECLEYANGRFCSLPSHSAPNIVWVFPEPVCPYANIVALIPWTGYFAISLAHSNTSRF